MEAARDALLNGDGFAEHAHNHAWDWFSLHSSQRMQAFNFFLVSTAFLLTAYGTLLDKYHWAAMVLALMGAWVTLWFNRIDARTKELIKAAERALKISEAQLSRLSQIPEIEIVAGVENAGHAVPTYSVAFNCIEFGIAAVFLVGALYATVVGLK